MAPRSSWRGYLRLSLVTCPVAMLPATSEAEKIRFHTLNRATGNRVHARYVDAETGKPVDDEDQVKGYERDDGEYIMFEDEELQAVALRLISEPKRIALLMAEVEEMTCPEIAAALQIPVGTVWTRLHSARRELRDALGGTES